MNNRKKFFFIFVYYFNLAVFVFLINVRKSKVEIIVEKLEVFKNCFGKRNEGKI